MAKAKQGREPGTFGKILRILSPSNKRVFFFLMVFTLGSSVLETATVGLMTPFVTAIVDSAGNAGASSWWQQLLYDLLGSTTQRSFIVRMSILMSVLYVFKGVYQYLLTRAKSRTIMRMRTALSAELFQTVLNKPYHYHLHHTTAELQRTVTTDVERTFALINNYMLLFTEGSVSLGIIALLIYTDPLLTLAVGGVLIIALVATNAMVGRTITRSGRINLTHTTEMLKWVQQAMGGLKGIYANRKQRFFVDKYASHAKITAESAEAAYIASAVPRLFVENITMACVFLVLALIALNGDIGSILPLIGTFALAMVRLIPVANRVTSAVTEVRNKKPAVYNVYTLIYDGDHDEAPGQKQPLTTIELGHPLHDGIIVDDITFSFEDTDQPLFEHLSLTIPAQKSVAFVGPTGAGKTTLADIILGLQIPSAGKVLADGIDIHHNTSWWASVVGYIPQFIYLCDDNIRSNVAFGYDSKDIDDDQVWSCLEDAQIRPFIESLPQGLDTVTGENGVRLSGGQRQRIGIARALYSKPSFLVMDEATSALDNETERALIETINKLSGKMTVLIIAHRLSTIKDCDIVYHVEHGRADVERS